jgi:hypothetical protein
MSEKQAQRIGFYLGVTINAANVLLNLIFAALYVLSAERTRASLNAAVAAFAAIVLWAIITIDRRLLVKQAIGESYLQEQQADSKLKQLMLSKLETGDIDIAAAAGRAGRAH